MQKMIGMVGLEENAGNCLLLVQGNSFPVGWSTLMNNEEDLELFLELYNASTKNGNCMLKMCSLQVSHSVNDAHSQAFTMIYFMITYSILLL